MSRCKVKDPNTTFHKNPSSGNIVIPCWQTDRQTDTKKLIAAFGSSFENALKNAEKIHDNRFAAGHRTKHLCNICDMLAVLKPDHYTYSTVTCWLTIGGQSLLAILRAEDRALLGDCEDVTQLLIKNINKAVIIKLLRYMDKVKC